MTDREAFVMTELSRGERYGLELVERSNGKLAQSGIYVLLDRMVMKGWIVARTAPTPPGESGPPRRLYRPTDIGRAHLAAHAVIVKAVAKASRRPK